MIEVEVDLHMHSRASFDGLMSVRTILETARRRGLAAVAVTDHNTLAGGVAAFEANRAPDLVVIVGVEVVSDIGDIVGLFVHQEVKSTAALDVVAEIHEQGGFAYLPHPFRHHPRLDEELLKSLDGVEIYNGRDHRPDAERALREFVAPHRLASMGGSDAHLPWEIGSARTRLRVPRGTVDSDALRAALEARDCYGAQMASRSVSAVLLSKSTKRLRVLGARVARDGSGAASASEPALGRLLGDNSPASFWGLGSAVPEDAWQAAARSVASVLPGEPLAHDSADAVRSVLIHTLGEGHMGPDRYRLGPIRRAYYEVVRPVLPARARLMLHRAAGARAVEGAALDWPVERRYVRYQEELLARAQSATADPVSPTPFWPEGAEFALVLTHDVEAAAGRDFVPEVVELEKKLGFRSSFNFVPCDYDQPASLRDWLEEEGFEVGVHGLHHDGRLFTSADGFARRARQINSVVLRWGAVGFRSPMTHREPCWMQRLAVQYDSSFFDTDPFEPMPGGTLSIWPYFLGDLVELPYTLPQDHTLLVTLAEPTPRLWLEKVDFIAEHGGMALLNSHPDYLLASGRLAIYEAFLREMKLRGGYWHALPRDVAAWWRARADQNATPH